MRSPILVLWRAVRHSPLTVVGLVLVALFVFVAVAAPWISPDNPVAQDLAHRLSPPSPRHPFGSDSLGRDVYSRILYGARISVVSGVAVVAAATAFGTAAGTVAGWLGGWWDEALMRLTDMFLAFPSLVLAMAISAILRPSLTNALAPLLVQATLDVGSIILTSAGLSFIGFGAQPPTPEWGLMVSEGRSFLTDQWWVATFPALAILLLVLGFNLLGDGIRDVMDPRLRKAG